MSVDLALTGEWERRGMCGVAAAINWPSAGAVVRRLIAGLAHRGEADDPVLEVNDRTAFQTRRLKIVDPDGGAQPKLSSDGGLLLILNGEIYNHRELRIRLEAEGVVLRSGSDTEVLVNLLQVFGPSALEAVRGMYAFVAYDLRTGAVLAGRDPFGEKPLYLVQEEGGLLFASEIAPLLAASQGEVLLVPPGFLVSARGAHRHYALPSPAAPVGRADPARVKALLQRAVERCLPEGLPTGLFFSGGVDSTLVARFAQARAPGLKAYALGGPSAPDHPYAALYAERSGLDLTFVEADLDGPALGPALDAVITAAETFEPSVVRPGLCYHALALKARRDGLKVVLTGEGADELFCGYRPMELAYAAGDAEGSEVRSQCLSSLNRSALQRTDRTTMRVGLEARSPFLDRDLADYAMALGGSALLADFGGAIQGKAPLRALFDDPDLALPSEIRDRRKRPLNEGAGLDQSQALSPVRRWAEAQISPAAFNDGRRRWREFELETPEELYYLERLAEVIDVRRVPHLKGRLKIAVSARVPAAALTEFA